MTVPYHDLFIRDYFSDHGWKNKTAPAECMSPDIIVWGTKPLMNADNYLVSEFDKTWYRNVEAKQDNYIYCRISNQASAPKTGRLFLYYANGGIWSDISKWRHQQVKPALGGKDYVDLSAAPIGRPGGRTVGDSAFVWAPDLLGHYCLIAQITTEDHPNPLPEKFTSSEEYCRWVVDNPGIAWRNIHIAGKDQPPSFQGNFNFHNPDQEARDYLFVVHAENVPKFTELSIMCGDVDLNPPIKGASKVLSNPSSLAAISTLPADFSGTLTASAKLPDGHTWEPHMKIYFGYYRIIDDADSDWFRALARPVPNLVGPEDTLATHPGTAVCMGRFTVLTDTEAIADSASTAISEEIL